MVHDGLIIYNKQGARSSLIPRKLLWSAAWRSGTIVFSVKRLLYHKWRKHEERGKVATFFGDRSGVNI